MKLEDAVSVIAHDFDKSFDHAFKEKIKIQIITARATIIRRELDKGRLLNESLINLVSAVPVSSTTDPANWYKTTCPIPKPVRLTDSDALLSVGSSLSKPYSKIEPYQIPYICEDLWGKDCSTNFYFYKNGFIYSNKNAPITLQMIADDPSQFSTFVEGCSSGTACDFEPDAFITNDMFDTIKRIIYETTTQVSKDKEVSINDQS